MNTVQAKKSDAGRRRWWMPLVAAILVVGTLFAWWLASRADREMRGEMLRQAHLVTQAVNGEHIKALSGTEADLGKPEYERLREQLASIRQANDQRRCTRKHPRVFGMCLLQSTRPPGIWLWAP